MSGRMKPPVGYRDPWELAGLPTTTPAAVALSGGADSVALLALLAKRENLLAVHVHHGIRGAEADRDAAFCRQLTDALGVPLAVLRVDVPALAAQSGESLETAAREARYAAIAALMREQGIPLLVTAHHADDQLETMLQHLLRGSGTRGLCGIPAVRELGEGLLVARPLLSVSKASLLDYLREAQLDYMVDSTNEEAFCQRNFLRLRVIPLLLELQPNAPLLAARCAEALAGDEQYLDGIAADFLQEQGSTPCVSALRALPRPVLVRVLRRLLPTVPTATHLAQIDALLADEKPGATLSLPGRVRLCITKGRLLYEEDTRSVPIPYEAELVPGENAVTPQVLAVLTSPAAAPIPREDYAYTVRVQLSRDALQGKLRLRSRREGDVVLSNGMHKAVRRMLAQTGLPPGVRQRVPLLADSAGVVAVPFVACRDGAGKAADLAVDIYFN